MTTGIIDRIVEICAQVDVDELDGETLKAAGLTFADTLAIVRLGSATPEMKALKLLLRGDGIVDRGPCTLVDGELSTTNAATAALLNGSAGSFSCLDGTGGYRSHPPMHIVPAALAVAEANHASGRALLGAFVAAFEVTVRLHQAFTATYPVHENGHLGAVGAAVASALLSGRDPVSCARIAGTTPILSVWDACHQGATARDLWFGYAAQAGVVSSLLDQAGFVGSASSLESAFGDIGGTWGDPDQAVRALDHRDLAIARSGFKRHAACFLAHSALDTALDMWVPPTELVERVDVQTAQVSMELAHQPGSANTLAGQFSLPYAVATALYLGRTDFDAFRYRPEVAELARRVDVSYDEDLDPWGARITVVWQGGIEVGTMHSFPRRLEADGVEARFHSVMADLPDESGIWQRLADLRGVEDCRHLVRGTEGSVPGALGATS